MRKIRNWQVPAILTVMAVVYGLTFLGCGQAADEGTPAVTTQPTAPEPVPGLPNVNVVPGDTWTHTHIEDVHLVIGAKTPIGHVTTIRVNGNQVVVEMPDPQIQQFIGSPPGTWHLEPPREQAAD